MPKSCSVPNCGSEPGTDPEEQRSYHKFPLQDASRLQQWLKNMDREDWIPSRHQHVCHQHFDPSCFRMRWGVRCMDKNAVPTVFTSTEKRKSSDLIDRETKRRHVDSEDNTCVSDGEANYVVCDSGLDIPMAFLQTGQGEDDTEVLVTVENQEQLVNAIASALLAQGLTVTAVSEDGADHVIALYQTPPQLSFSSDTVLASALSPQPITSTLPIVSNQTPPPATEDGDQERSEDEDSETLPPHHKLEEHSYHRSSVSEQQLQRTVCELQKTVEVLQRRQRRHVERLTLLENTVTQLSHSNLLNQERLQLLERVHPQSDTGASDAGEMVTIIYEEDGSFLFTPLAHTHTQADM